MAKEKLLKKEVIFFSKHTIGGVQNYYHNIISNDPYCEFEKKWIFTNYEHDNNPKPLEPYNCCEELIFNYSDDETIYEIAKRLNKLISDKEGIVMTNTYTELATLHIYPKKNKTILFVCHDEGYLKTAREFEFLIDVFIAHNEFFFSELTKLFPKRIRDIYYLPYGVKLTGYKRISNTKDPLKIIFIARLQKEKGVYDLPIIDLMLKAKGVRVEWTIIGDGPEKLELQKIVKERDNFLFDTPVNTDGVLKYASQNDIFVLPSRLDGLPVALLESMSVGLVPIISEFNPGINKVVTEKEGFVVSVNNNEEFVLKILMLNEDRLLLDELSEASFNKIQKEYSSKDRALSYYNLFRKYKELKKTTITKRPNYGNLIHQLRIPKNTRRIIKNLALMFKLKSK
jgi:glycosyltransferase involved in cell wall biosynthesis